MNTNITVELSLELAESLTQLAQEARLSLSELAQMVLVSYVSEQTLDQSELELTEEELVELDASFAEADKPGAIWYSDAEANQELDRLIAERRAIRKSKNMVFPTKTTEARGN